MNSLVYEFERTSYGSSQSLEKKHKNYHNIVGNMNARQLAEICHKFCNVFHKKMS